MFTQGNWQFEIEVLVFHGFIFFSAFDNQSNPS